MVKMGSWSGMLRVVTTVSRERVISTPLTNELMEYKG